MVEQNPNIPTQIPDDGSLASLRLPRPDGRKTFHCEKITQSALVNRTFWLVDYVDTGVCVMARVVEMVRRI